MIISKVTSADIPKITALQAQFLIANTDAKNGFLVSAFSEQEYLHFIEKYEFFYKAVEGDRLLGVVMAFHSDNVDPKDINNSLLRNTVMGDCVIIKQIFVSPDTLGKGVAAELYNHLFSKTGDLPTVCVIVIEPFNGRSCYFHKKHGFVEYLNFTPNADKDGVIRKRSAWIRLTNLSPDVIGSIRLSNILCDDDDSGEVMASRASDFISLYQHEDNLNWTKFGMQTTILFALFASFAYFYEKSVIDNVLPVLIVLGLWGIVINYLFLIKIKSGLYFMNVHKNKIKEYDKLLMFYYPKVMPIFANHEHITKKSITSHLLYCISIIGLLSWVSVAILLILKALRICVLF